MVPGDNCRMNRSKNPYKRYRFPPEIIQYTVWLYHRFNLSHRDIEDMLAEQGADVNMKDRYGVTPMMLAMGDPEQRLVAQINGGPDHRFRNTAPKINKIMVDLLIELGAEPFTGEYRGREGL